jgi:hypothetical protein
LRFAAVGVFCFLAASPAGEFTVGQGACVGYSYWNGWSGRSLGVFVEPRVSSGLWGLGLNFSVTTERVKKDGQAESFLPVGAMLKGCVSVLEAGVGLGHVPGFISRTGRVSRSAASPCWMVGASFPVVEWDRYALRMGLANFGLTELDRFVNPALTLVLDYRPGPGGKAGKGG